MSKPKVCLSYAIRALEILVLALVCLVARPAYAASNSAIGIDSVTSYAELKKNRIIFVRDTNIDPDDEDFGFSINFKGPVSHVEVGEGCIYVDDFDAFLYDEPDAETNKLYIVATKPGVAPIFYTYQGRRHWLYITVKNWRNPFKKFMVGTKNVANGFKYNHSYAGSKVSLKNKVLKITPNSGFKLKSIVCVYKNGTKKTIKNGKRLPRTFSRLEIKMTHVSTGINYVAYIGSHYEP
ncbi:MAG: hypothetical protein Q4A07_06275 [Coriobacteriales bacterium]|nr:hypothetical protein [Coriobacteriales bacterium]